MSTAGKLTFELPSWKKSTEAWFIRRERTEGGGGGGGMLVKLSSKSV